MIVRKVYKCRRQVDDYNYKMGCMIMLRKMIYVLAILLLIFSFGCAQEAAKEVQKEQPIESTVPEGQEAAQPVLEPIEIEQPNTENIELTQETIDAVNSR